MQRKQRAERITRREKYRDEMRSQMQLADAKRLSSAEGVAVRSRHLQHLSDLAAQSMAEYVQRQAEITLRHAQRRSHGRRA